MDWGSCTKTVTDANGNSTSVATMNCIPVIFVNIINAALIFSGATALVFIIISGLTLMNSAGDPKKVTGAKGTLTYAILGLVLVLLAFGIVNVISYLTGVQCITQFGFSQCS